LLDGPGAGRSNTRPPVSGGQVAQLVEQRTENPRVGSSILSLATSQTMVHSGDMGKAARRGDRVDQRPVYILKFPIRPIVVEPAKFALAQEPSRPWGSGNS
jgi:hypothetical protein